MVSTYDIFYVLVLKNDLRIVDITTTLGKESEERHNIRKKVLKLKEEGLVEMNGKVKIIENEKSRKLYQLILFCTKNGMNYNVLFNDDMLTFIQKSARKEFFTKKDIDIHNITFARYVEILQKYGFLLVVSRKPLKCKLLQHHFLENLLDYFGKTLKFYKSRQHSFLPQIRKEFSKFKRGVEVSFSLYHDLEQKEEIRFIHMSLSLEGNPVTLSDTRDIILKQVIPKKYKLQHIQEITNYKKAVDLMIENAKSKVKLTLSLILKYHGLAMVHIHGAGELRKHNVRIKGNSDFKTADWHELNTKLDALMKKYDEFEKKTKDIGEIISFASFFHVEFQRIHPFNDGNSRTSRLLMLHILRSHGLPVLDLPIGYFDLYMNLTKRSTKRDDVSFQHLIEEIVFFNLKRANSLFI